MIRYALLAMVFAWATPVFAEDPATQPATTQPSGDEALHPRYEMKTSLGTIVLQLDAEKAPISTLNFHRYATSTYYAGTIFHRVISNFMIQGGGFTPELDKKTEGLLPPIKNEWRNGLTNDRGTIAMARLGGNPDSATSQFFINVVDNARLDRPQQDGAAYAVFGKVIDGMDVVDKIRYTELELNPKYPSRQPVTPVTPVVIESVELVGTFDVAKAEKQVQELEQAEREAAEKARAERQHRRQQFIEQTEAQLEKKFQSTDSGLMYIVLQDGDGPTPQKGDKVSIHYTGMFLDGEKFDSSHDRGKPFTFSTERGAIRGMLEGVLLMKVGGTMKLLIPAELGYGERGYPPTIPPNTDLAFDVELLSIEQPQE